MARWKRNGPRYGFYVDHILDAVGTFFLIGGMALSTYLSPAVAAAFLIAYLLLFIEIISLPTPWARSIFRTGDLAPLNCVSC